MLSTSSSLFYARGNEAVEINAPTGVDFHITEHGSNWLWTVFSLFSLATLVVVTYALLKKSRNERLFYHMTAISMFVLSIQYFTMASNLGWAPVQAEFNHVTTEDQSVVPGLRQIFYARWVGYFLAFPPYLLGYAALVGLTWSNALFTIVAQEVTVISFLIGTLIQSTYKWGYYTFGVVGFFLVATSLLYSYTQAAKETDSSTLSKHSWVISSLYTLLFMLYPISWALSEGGNVIQPDSEAVFYGVLDLCFFLVVGAYFHSVADQVNFEQRGIAGFQNKVFASQHPQELPYFAEKVAAPVTESAPEAAVEAPRASDDTAAAAHV